MIFKKIIEQNNGVENPLAFLNAINSTATIERN
jgi:hypothetical protein